MGIPNCNDFIQRININSILYLTNSRNPLVREAIKDGIKHAGKKKRISNIFDSILQTMKRYNIELKECNDIDNDINLDQMEGHSFNIHTDGSKIENQVGFGINIYNSENRSFKYSFKIHEEYSNNVAEIMAILTAIKMLPNHSNANVHTDSQVAIEVLKKSYRGDFQGFQEEFFGTIKDKHLNIHLVKVKGHEDPENIIVDKLAKEGAQGQNMIDITKLLSQNQKILINTNKKTIIFDYRKYIKDIQRKEYLDIVEDKSDLPFNQSQSLTNINLKYMDQRFDTETKLSIWRNMTDSHIRQFRQVYCDNCECEVDLEHFIYYCEETECFRRYFLTKFTNLTGASCKLRPHDTFWDRHNSNLNLNHRGFIKALNIILVKPYNPKIIDNWHEIQSLLSLLVGKAHRKYYSCSLNSR